MLPSSILSDWGRADLSWCRLPCFCTVCRCMAGELLRSFVPRPRGAQKSFVRCHSLIFFTVQQCKAAKACYSLLARTLSNHVARRQGVWSAQGLASAVVMRASASWAGPLEALIAKDGHGQATVGELRDGNVCAHCANEFRRFQATQSKTSTRWRRTSSWPFWSVSQE